MLVQESTLPLKAFDSRIQGGLRGWNVLLSGSQDGAWPANHFVNKEFLYLISLLSRDGFQVPIIRSLTASRSAGTCQAAVTGEDDQDLGKWCRHPLSQGHQRIFLRRERVFSIPEYITCAKVVIWHDFLVRPSLVCDRQFLLFKYSGSMSI